MKGTNVIGHCWRLAALPLSLSLVLGSVVAQETEPGGNRAIDPGKARVIDYWTENRRQQAAPRDLVIDSRGLGYLRRADGSLEPYGHQITAEAQATPSPQARPPSGGDDTDSPLVVNMDPGAGETIGGSATFSATVTDASGVRSVSVIIGYPDSATTQTFQASQGPNDVWSVPLQGFSDGNWRWQVEAKDNAKKGGNSTTTAFQSFTVATGGGSVGSGGESSGGGGSDTVTNGVWNSGGDVETAVGRIYFEMPSNSGRKRWNGYVCSGTVVRENNAGENIEGRSVILTAAHCVYDDANKAFARNVLFIPNQAGTSGSGTDLNCGNDPLGCWAPSIGVVDVDWTTRTFPNNIPWDYAYYVVSDSGSHAGGGAGQTGILDQDASSLAISFSLPNHDDTNPGATSGDFTHALGYSYSQDPYFMYCAEDMTTEGVDNWWLPSCGLSGGSSGGAWAQPLVGGTGPIISVNSWGYSTQPGMAGPRLDDNSAACLFTVAKSEYLNPDGYADGDAGTSVSSCP
jgi:hypothetical protein